MRPDDRGTRSSRVYQPELLPGAVVTYTARIFFPLDPDWQDIAIEDVAHALSNCCRFTGHVSRFYSVAQHSVHVSEIVPAHLALPALLHDASEAYLSDMSRPIKRQPVFGEVYKKAEDRLMVAVAKRFGFDWPMDEAIHDADDVLLRTEQRDLMPDLLRVPGDDYLDARIQPWGPSKSERLFLARYYELNGD